MECGSLLPLSWSGSRAGGPRKSAGKPAHSIRFTPPRPCFVEALALHLFSHRVLGPNHFEPRKGGVYLNDPGRCAFLEQYESRMTHEFFCEHVGHRTTLRQQLEQQALTYKAALADQSQFSPFRMN